MLGDFALGDAPLGDEGGGGAPPTTTYDVYPIGVASEEAFGSPVITAYYQVNSTGVASQEAFGSPQVTPNLQVVSLSGDSFSAFGILAFAETVHYVGFSSTNSGVKVFADGFSSLNSILGMTYGEFTSVGGMHLEVLTEFTMRCMEQVQGEFESKSRMMDNPIGAFTMTSSMTQEVLQAFTSQSLIMDSTPVLNYFKSVAVIEPDMGTEVLSQTSVQLIADDIEILLSSVTMTFSEDRPEIEATVILVNVGDFHRLEITKPATLVLAGVTYNLIIIETSISQSEGDIQAGIRLVSPIALLGMNDHVITKTWEATTASAAFAELVSPLTVDWQVDDWNLPDKRLALTNVTALAGAQSIATATGAFIQSKNDGSLLVRYKYDPPVETYEGATVLYLYDSIDEVFSVSESVATILAVNKLRILDVTPSSFADKIEYDQPNSRLLVFPSPWRETLSVTHTSLGSVILTPIGPVDIEKTEETLEFKAGTASVSYPIWSIVSVTWLGKDLGGLTFSPAGTDFTSTDLTEKYSIAKIVYRTKALEWKVSTIETVVQFLVED